eukprot:GDKI01003104.1.p1 GENE.GDKI01003104.1~~GDKI01003104.1.p1  ORF type:complete len:102 (-),score=14.00 GDKI01003104.1:62-367(-)
MSTHSMYACSVASVFFTGMCAILFSGHNVRPMQHAYEHGGACRMVLAVMLYESVCVCFCDANFFVLCLICVSVFFVYRDSELVFFVSVFCRVFVNRTHDLL